MAVIVKVKAPKLTGLKKELNSARAVEVIGEGVLKEIKRFIRIGTSPVLGVGRFDSYKDKTKYPGDKKNSKPVNLELTGDMLDAIDYRQTQRGITVGVFDSEQAKKAKTHQGGLNGVPQRRFMPTAPGEKFNVSISRSIRNLYVQIISAILK